MYNQVMLPYIVKQCQTIDDVTQSLHYYHIAATIEKIDEITLGDTNLEDNLTIENYSLYAIESDGDTFYLAALDGIRYTLDNSAQRIVTDTCQSITLL